MRTFDEYQTAAMRTAGDMEDSVDGLVCYALGAAGEAGELANKVKKIVFHGHSYEVDKLAEEAGDTLWYLAALADVIGVPLAEIAARNIDKLRGRYPQGFTHEASINRKEGNE
jgi:NTP pyrophosphatase (non-canonical NTP hydrolase)